MLNALKRLTGRPDTADGGITAAASNQAIHAMSANLQKKFARGVQYNMKIVLKGDRNVGKTCLFERLQGKGFKEVYNPTDEIQVASIHWNYKATEDVVKVEVWDVVDKSKKKKTFEGLKFDNNQEIPEIALDAEFVDVYKGANGVILVLDITKDWTFHYIERELGLVPPQIPVLVLANHCDMAHHRAVSRDAIAFFIESFDRGEGSAQVRWTECSMRNGFGLKLIHKFFNLPFLQLQQCTLLAQLSRNKEETEATAKELDILLESDETDYNKFVVAMSAHRRVVAESKSMTSISAVSTRSAPPAQPLPTISLVNKKPGTGPAVSVLPTANVHCPPSATAAVARRSSSLTTLRSQSPLQSLSGKQVASVEEFIPDDALDKSFLEDADAFDPVRHDLPSDQESDEGGGGNPLVSGFQDELDPEDSVFKPIPRDQISRSESNASLPKEEGWMIDSKWRRSPEGGEDVTRDTSDLLDTSQFSVFDALPTTRYGNSQNQEEIKKSKKKTTKKDDTEKKKTSKKDKTKSNSEEKKKKKSSKLSDDQDQLEMFLNSPVGEGDVDAAYEAF